MAQENGLTTTETASGDREQLSQGRQTVPSPARDADLLKPGVSLNRGLRWSISLTALGLHPSCSQECEPKLEKRRDGTKS